MPPTEWSHAAPYELDAGPRIGFPSEGELLIGPIDNAANLPPIGTQGQTGAQRFTPLLLPSF